jgi:hypothetical protein
MVALLQVNQPKIPTARLVIPSEVEGFRSVTVRLLRGIPRLRFAPLGMTQLI